MHPDTSTFIETLYGRCHQDLPSFLTLTAIHPDGSYPTPSRHVQVGNTAALEQAYARLLLANQRGWGAYLGIATRKADLGRWSRGGKADLVELPALFVDIDNPDDALFRFIRCEPPPSCIVHSGHGFHAYWFLAEPTRDFATADNMLHGLAQSFASDEKMTVAQSMRLPGTQNTKVGREGTLCSLVVIHPDWRYALSDFRPYLRQQRKIFTRREAMWLPTGETHEIIEAVTDAVIHQLEGCPKRSGWIAARCPYEHARDGPGQHFSYHPGSGIGYCFGRHGKVSLSELCHLLGIYTTGIKLAPGRCQIPRDEQQVICLR